MLEPMKVSRDKGASWTDEMIDIHDINPETSQLKVGDIVLYKGFLYEIFVRMEAKRIENVDDVN